MAKKKNTKQTAKIFKPEDYIRQKARLLPIYKCYKAINTFEDREMSIFVVRQHTQGTFTYAAYLIDKWCLGVKDTMWEFCVSKSDLEGLLSRFQSHLHSLEEIEYVEAHNWVYGALEFAEEAGIKPCKGFALTKYILEEDDENVELIEYEFGRNGEYCLVAKDQFEASMYIPTLDKTLGKENYKIEIGPFDDIPEDDEHEHRHRYDPVPYMEYTYKGKDYPKEITLHYPEVETIVIKETEQITDEEMDKVLSLPEEDVREDLQNLVWREMGRQWGKTELNDDETTNCCIVGNSFMFLTKFATVDKTLPVVLEAMRQGEAFHDYNFGDISNILLYPVLCVLIKDNPRLLKPYLLEPGLHTYFKITVLELLEHIAQHCPNVRQEIIDMTVEILQEYKEDLPNRTICDGGVAAFAIGILVGTGATEHLGLIEDLYATGLVDEDCEGTIDEVRETIQDSHIIFDLPPMDPYSVRQKYINFVQRNCY